MITLRALATAGKVLQTTVMTNTTESVQDAMLDAEKRVHESLRTLKRYYGLTNAQIAEGMGVRASWVQERTRGVTPCHVPDLRGFASFFGVEVDCLFMERDELVRWVLDHPDRGHHLLRTQSAWFTAADALRDDTALRAYESPLLVG